MYFGTLLLPLCQWESEGEEWDDGSKTAVRIHETGRFTVTVIINNNKVHVENIPFGRMKSWCFFPRTCSGIQKSGEIPGG